MHQGVSRSENKKYLYRPLVRGWTRGISPSSLSVADKKSLNMVNIMIDGLTLIKDQTQILLGLESRWPYLMIVDPHQQLGVFFLVHIGILSLFY